MAQLFGSSWWCLLLAGVWSLACGYMLRRAWTSEAEEDKSAQLASSRNEAVRLRTDVDARNTRVQALETDLTVQRTHVAEVEAAKAAELQSLTQRLASFEAKAAGFDLARVTSLKTVAERDQTIADLNGRLQVAQAALADARTHAEANQSAGTKAAADLAAAHTAWKIERASLVDEHGLKLAALERTLAEAKKHRGSEIAALEQRGKALESLAAKFAATEGELSAAKRTQGERDTALSRAAADASRTADTLKERDSEIQALKDQLRTLGEQRDAATKRRDEDLARLSAELRGRIGTLEAEGIEWRRRTEAAERQAAAKNEQIAGLNGRIEELLNTPAKVVERIVEVEKIVTVAAPLVAAQAAAPRTGPAPQRHRDDLKVIEGIGPKIEKLLNDAGYLSFSDVAVADPNALALVMERAGPRFALARTDTWPEQAQLLVDGNMEAFKKLTDELKGGVRR